MILTDRMIDSKINQRNDLIESDYEKSENAHRFFHNGDKISEVEHILTPSPSPSPSPPSPPLIKATYKHFQNSSHNGQRKITKTRYGVQKLLEGRGSAVP